MDDRKLKLRAAVAARLAAAPASAEKDELIEELSDNLYRRFLEMSGAGVPEEEAFDRALENLGDVDELLSYLGATAGGGNGQAGAGQSQSRREEGGRYHYDPNAAQSDLDALLAGVQQVCSSAIGHAKSALHQAKDALQRRTTVEKDNGHVKVHFDTDPDAAPSGWEFEAELNPDQGRFFAGGGPKEHKSVVYSFGYDKARGGFFTEWGEQEPAGSHFTGESAQTQPQDGGVDSIAALKDLRGLSIQTIAGDVAIHVSEEPGAGVVIDGDVDDLEVTCSADGVLNIREGRTASSSFFSRRGFSSADVELFIPRRHWETISVTTVSGDINIDREALDVGQLSVATASGDLDAKLRACAQLRCKSASGDVELSGQCADLRVETASGDVAFRGQAGQATFLTASGDLELEGLVEQLHGSTMSGDIAVATSQLPGGMDLSSQSGDLEVRIPDAGPFSVRMKTTNGEIDCAFPVNYVNGVCVYGAGAGPAYSLKTINGDVTIERY